MRSAGINWWAAIGAAFAIYAIGFVIYVGLIPMDRWWAMTGMTDAEKAIANSRMALSPIMPILTALFLGLLFKWGEVGSAAEGMKWAAMVALGSALPALLYDWVYGGMSTAKTAIDCAHLLSGHLAAGAILGRWR